MGHTHGSHTVLRYNHQILYSGNASKGGRGEKGKINNQLTEAAPSQSGVSERVTRHVVGKSFTLYF